MTENEVKTEELQTAAALEKGAEAVEEIPVASTKKGKRNTKTVDAKVEEIPDTKATIAGWWSVGGKFGDNVVVADTEAEAARLYFALHNGNTLLDGEVECVALEAMPQCGSEAIHERKQRWTIDGKVTEKRVVMLSPVQVIDDWIARRNAAMEAGRA